MIRSLSYWRLHFVKVFFNTILFWMTVLLKHNVRVLAQIFNELFIGSYGTELKPGGDEPIYLPRSETGNHDLVISTKDYFSSALHEISHWCIAGEERRKLVDFGYWYEPDGRSEAKQREFERVEIKPQALEWLFTEACGVRFRLSVDNTENPEIFASEIFMRNVVEQANRYLEEGLKGRAADFLQALMKHYRPNDTELNPSNFAFERLA